MTNYLGLYILLNIFCVGLVLICVIHSRLSVGELESQIRFRWTLRLLAVFYISDTLWYAMDQGLLPQILIISMLLKSVYFLSACAAGYTYFIYMIALLNNRLVNNYKFITICIIPFAIHAILCVINLFIPFLFHIDSSFVYHRDKFFWLQYLFMYIYMVSGALYALYTAFLPDNFVERSRFLAIALFPVLPAISGLLQLFYWRIPLNAIAFTTSAIFVYLIEMGQQISKEPLTGLSNRREFVRSLMRHIENKEDNSLYYLFIMDIDDFKKINDNYGHLEGDDAILMVSDALKQATSSIRRNVTVARYGGDEFAIVADLKDDNEAKQLIKLIHEEIQKKNELNEKGYSLSLSIDYVLCNEIETVKEMIDLADKRLYEVKNSKMKV